MIREILDYLKVNEVEYKENYSMGELSTVRTGGRAAVVAYPRDEKGLVDLICFLDDNKYRYKILGRMSNVLPPDEFYYGVIVKTDRIAECLFDGSAVTASAGASLPSLAMQTCNRGFSGLEELSGIPGSIAGALYGNAGAFGREISDLVLDVRAYDIAKRKIKILSREDCRFGYRDSLFKSRPSVILSARLLLTNRSVEEINTSIKGYRQKRKSTQPNGASLGSTFKRIDGISAGKLIDLCGLKGYRIGGAEISTVHAGFILNVCNATAEDYLRLADYAARCVYEKFGIRIEREIEIM